MATPTNRLKLVEEIFQKAADAPSSERDRVLDQLCQGDPELRAEVAGLLVEMGADVQGMVAAASGLLEHAEDAGAPIPERVGPFAIVGVLGEGGMGRVYEAEQESPRRRVAVKVMRPGAVSPQSMRRFRFEAEVLGSLKHPGIAQVFQSGSVTDEQGHGRPYFAMELVRGPSLTGHARAHALSIRQRLELLALVCDAVQHAHHRGIIHRDLKPGNILVEQAEGAPAQPKILDFGIARVTGGQPLAARVSMQTGSGQIVGTLAYMAPEALSGDAERVDTRTDIYALGVIGYELLGGALPIDLDGKSIAEAARMIAEIEPRRLGAINPALRGDVETIIAKAMDKEPPRRYPSAGELAADLRRHLANQAIMARPSSAMYQLTKFSRRHRGLVAGLATAAAAILVGSGLAVWQAVNATRQRDAARLAQTRAEGLRDFLVKDVFGQMSPARLGPNALARDLLVKSVDQMNARFAGDQDMLIQSESMFANLAQSIGDLGMAMPHADRAAALLREHLGAEHPETIRADIVRLSLRSEAGDLAALEADAAALVERAERSLGPMHPLAMSAGSLIGIMRLMQNRNPEAADVMAELAARYKHSSQARTQDHFIALNLLLSAYRAQRRMEDALIVSEEAMELCGPGSLVEERERLAAMHAHGQLLMMLGRYEESESMMRRVYADSSAVLAPDDVDTGQAASLLGLLLVYLQRYAEAEPLLKEGARIINKRLGEDHWESMLSRWKIHLLFIRSGDKVRLEEWLKSEIALMDRVKGGSTDPMCVEVRRLYCRMLLEQSRLDEAEALLNEVQPAVDGWGPENQPVFRAAVQVMRGVLLNRRGRTDEARRILEPALQVIKANPQFLFQDVAPLGESELSKMK